MEFKAEKRRISWFIPPNFLNHSTSGLRIQSPKFRITSKTHHSKTPASCITFCGDRSNDPQMMGIFILMKNEELGRFIFRQRMLTPRMYIKKTSGLIFDIPPEDYWWEDSSDSYNSGVVAFHGVIAMNMLQNTSSELLNNGSLTIVYEATEFWNSSYSNAGISREIPCIKEKTDILYIGKNPCKNIDFTFDDEPVKFTDFIIEVVPTIKENKLGTHQILNKENSLPKRAFKVHRMILSSNCTVFEAILNGEFKEAKDRKIIIQDIKPKAVGQMLNFLYNKECPKYVDEAFEDVLKISDKF